MSDYDCSGSSNRESGQIAHTTLYDSYTWTSGGDCETTFLSDYEIDLSVNATSNPDFDPDELGAYGGSNEWYVNSFFSIEPGNLISQSCPPQNSACFDPNCEEVQPHDVEFWVGHFGSQDMDYWTLSNPRPDDGDDSDSAIFDFALSMLAGFKWPWGAAGAYIFDYVSNSIISDGVSMDFEETNYREEMHWEVDMNAGGGNDDLPTSECKTTGVRFTIENRRDVDGIGEVPIRNRYTFSYIGYRDDDACTIPCANPAGERYVKTTERAELTAEYETV